MPVFNPKSGQPINTDAVLLQCTAAFARQPTSFQWQRLVVAMLAHQQAHYIGDVSLIIDAQNASEEEVARIYSQTQQV